MIYIWVLFTIPFTFKTSRYAMKKKELMYFLGNDAPCESIGGTCQQNTLPCPGGYQAGLCGGGLNRRCCKSKFFWFLCLLGLLVITNYVQPINNTWRFLMALKVTVIYMYYSWLIILFWRISTKLYILIVDFLLKLAIHYETLRNFSHYNIYIYYTSEEFFLYKTTRSELWPSASRRVIVHITGNHKLLSPS